MSSRGKPITNQMKLERRKQADKRNEEYSKLSLEQKLARLPVEGAKRQRARLERLIEQAKAPAKAEAKVSEPSTDGDVVDAHVVEKSKPKKGKKQS